MTIYGSGTEAVPDAIMYRSEAFAGEGYRDPAEVLAHEAFEMQNSDAVLYMLEHYLEPGTELCREGERLYDIIETGQEDAEYNDVRGFFRRCLETIREKTGKAVVFGLWLAEEKVVMDFYCRGLEWFFLDSYETAGAVVLDDLGYDGMFLGFSEEQFPVSSRLVERSP